MLYDRINLYSTVGLYFSLQWKIWLLCLCLHDTDIVLYTSIFFFSDSALHEFAKVTKTLGLLIEDMVRLLSFLEWNVDNYSRLFLWLS